MVWWVVPAWTWWPAGIDPSPDAAAYLGLDGSGTVRWRFVDPRDVPASGPWRGHPAIDQVTHGGS